MDSVKIKRILERIVSVNWGLTLSRVVEALPLTAFLVYAGLFSPNSPSDWEGPYYSSSLLALMSVFLFTYRKILFNRIFLGINIYLISGSLALLTDMQWLNSLYDRMEASGMLAWVIVVGIVSAMLSPEGFIGVQSVEKQTIKLYSLYLLLFSMGVFLFSYYFQGNRLLSEIIPFVFLFAVRNILCSRVPTLES